MAQKVTVSRDDDLEGGPAEQTVRFSLAGAEYEIDLNGSNADWFRSLMAPFVDHARRTGRAKGLSVVRGSANRERAAGIRAWARERGLSINERGRIPASVTEQYEAAMRTTSSPVPPAGTV